MPLVGRQTGPHSSARPVTAVMTLPFICTQNLETAQSFEFLTSDNSGVLTGSPKLSLKGKELLLNYK